MTDASPSSAPPAAASPENVSWGYQRPDCRGANALGLFIDDLHRVLEGHEGKVAKSPAALYQAQADTNALVRRYADLTNAPAVFAGQSITLRTAPGEQGGVQLVPLFSPGLKQALIALLRAGESTQ